MLTTTASSSKFNAIPVVAILGGGYAGVAVAQNLDKALGDKIEIILITKNDKFFHNIGSPRVLVEPEFAEQLFTSYDNMFKHKEKRSVVQAGISQLNANQVTLDNGQTIKFDYCCIATGSVYADPFKPASNSSAESIDHMKQVHEKLKSAKSFLIVGGGSKFTRSSVIYGVF